MTKTDLALPAKRLRLLIRQLESEGHTKTDVAQMLGINATLITKLQSDPRKGIDSATLARVVQTMCLDANFFFALELGDAPHYRHHRHEQDGVVMPPHWGEFLRRYSRIDELSEDDLARIRAFKGPFFQVQSWADWASLASWLLDRRVDGAGTAIPSNTEKQRGSK